MMRTDIFKRSWPMVLLLVTGLIAGWLGLAGAASTGPIKVGLMVPLTGFAVEDGNKYHVGQSGLRRSQMEHRGAQDRTGYGRLRLQSYRGRAEDQEALL